MQSKMDHEAAPACPNSLFEELFSIEILNVCRLLYIFKVFKDLPDFCYSKFLQAVQRNETDQFSIFLFAKVSHNQPLFDVDSSQLLHLIPRQVLLQQHQVKRNEEKHFYKHTHTMILLCISRVKKVEMSKFGLHFETKKKLHIQFTVLLAKATICRGAKF